MGKGGLNSIMYQNVPTPRTFELLAFVCGTLFGRIKLNQLYSPKQSSTYKSAILADLQRSQVAEFAISQWYSTAVDLPVCTRLLNLVPVATQVRYGIHTVWCTVRVYTVCTPQVWCTCRYCYKVTSAYRLIPIYIQNF